MVTTKTSGVFDATSINMTSRSNWRGRLLVDMSTGKTSVDKSGQGTSDTFILTSYDPTAAKQKQHDESRLSSPSLMETFMEFEPTPDLSTLEIVENVNTTVLIQEPSATEPVVNANMTLAPEPFKTEPVVDANMTMAPEPFTTEPVVNANVTMAPEPFITEPVVNANTTMAPEPFTTEPVVNANITMAPEPFITEPVDYADINIPTLETFAVEPINYAEITITTFEPLAIEPLEYYDEIILTTPDSPAAIRIHHDSEFSPQPLLKANVNSEHISTETSVYNTNSYLDEATGLFENRSTGNGHFILNEQTGELMEMDTEPDENHNEYDINEIHENKRNRDFNKKQRVMGKPYMGRKMEKNNQNSIQTLSFIAKDKKELKIKACSHSATEAKSSRTFLCGAISEEQREATFHYYWSLGTWDAKKAYLKNLVRPRPIKRRRKATQGTTKLVKEQGFDCFLPNENNELIRVCKNFLLKTLVMTNDTLNTWIKHLHESRSGSSHVEKNPRANASSKSAIVREWLGLLPKVSSHYCRASTSRIYVEDSFRSKTHMFKVYKKWCTENEKEAAKRKLFCTVLKAENISIFKPRKDQCDTCTAFKEGNLTQEEYETHTAMKEEAYKAKTNAQSLCSSEVLVVTMDVQSVLLAPKLQVSAQYYKQKLQIHNFTLYCSNDKDVHLYVWHEGDGGVTANEFTTCIIDFLNLKLVEGFKKIILISDGCCYQNRNKVLSSALLNLTVDKSIDIEQIILEKGHTMMQVDSVHSTLEHLFKAPIYSPNDFINLMAQARPSKPYVVHHLEYGFFKNYERTCQLDSIRPGKKTGDPVVTDIRGLLYKDGDIFFKLRHPHEWKILPQRKLRINVSLTGLYSTARKIEKTKYESLQSLKNFMHRDYHCFYDNLIHN